MTDTDSDQPRGLIALACHRPVAVTMIVLAVAVFGWVSLGQLRTTLLPKISYPSLTIRTEYVGAAPAEVEELVTRPLETNLAVVSGLSSFRSVSRAGVSDIILEFDWETNMSFAAQDVREKVDQARPFLPTEVKKPLLLKYDPTLDPILRIGLFGSDDMTRLRFQAEEILKKKLEALPGVAAVRVKGGHEAEIRIDINEQSLREYNIGLDTITARLAEENVNLASGMLRDGDAEYLVRTLNQFRSTAEIADLVLAVRKNQPIRLSDVARVRETFTQPDVITRMDGVLSVEMDVFKEDAANVVTVAKLVKEACFGKKGSVDGSSEKEKKDQATQRLQDTLPPGMKMRILTDQSRFIEGSIQEVQTSGIIGALCAIIVLFAFLRNGLSTAIIAVSIPISVIATFGPMLRYDVTLNIMSLGGLALGIGMLVDASIVVLESIARRREEGDDILTAAIRGTQDVSGAVTASVLTTVAVFFPIVFVSGIAGEIFKDQSLTVVFSLLASLAVALFLIPMLASRDWNRSTPTTAPATTAKRIKDLIDVRHWGSSIWLINGVKQLIPRRAQSAFIRFLLVIGILPLSVGFVIPVGVVFFMLEFMTRIMGAILFVAARVVALAVGFVLTIARRVLYLPAIAFDRAWQGGVRLYGITLSACLRLPAIVLLAAAGMIAAAGFIGKDIGIELIPAMHSGEIIVEIPQPVGTALAATSRATRVAEDRIKRLRNKGDGKITGTSTVIGVARDEIAPPGDGPHTAKIHISLRPAEDVAALETEAIDEIRTALEGLPELSSLSFSAPRLFTVKNPLEIQITGERLENIERLGRILLGEIQELEGLTDVESTLQDGSPEFVIRYDRRALALHGLTLQEAASTLRNKVKGIVATRFSVASEGRKIDVLVKTPEEEVPNRDALRNIRVAGSDGRDIRLADVASVIQGRGPSEVRHIGGERAVFLTAKPTSGSLSAAAQEIDDVVARLRNERPMLFNGVSVRVAGQTAEAEKSSRELLFALGLALILVYIVMASQFESLLDPLLIMGSSIFAGVGVVLGLYLTQTTASVVVFIGCIMLAGIVVNNAIVLIDRINRLIRDGLARDDAIREAATQRLRPIIMTTLTTILGLLPMALSQGEAAEIRTPMAITVIFGLALSTVLTLIIIPVIYKVAHNAMDGIGRTFSGGLRKSS